MDLIAAKRRNRDDAFRDKSRPMELQMRLKHQWAAMVAAAALAACSAPPAGTQAAEGLPPGCITDVPAQIGGPISLVDTSGAPTTQARFAGRPTLVYFGFAFCPDVCPAALQTARATLDALGPAAADIQTALITLDPERDTPEALSRYVGTSVFPEGLVGLTGSVQQTTDAAKAFRVAWRKSETPNSAAGYLIDHSSFFYLMSPEWKTLALYPSTLAPADAARCIAAARGAPAG